ncbi:Arginyl-tRNA--protein transferase 1 [Coemansia sp. RSA 552]|nr:Arginyl-tRNA--protein transferase 1 [Coemansia sp. RSA 552]
MPAEPRNGSTADNNSSQVEESAVPPPSSGPAPALRPATSRSHVQILGMQNRSQCGYCGTPSGSRFFGARGRQLTCADYQAMVDRGWRRSGTLLYLTDHSDSCCAYYTIRTHALRHELRRSDKKLLRRWHRLELLGDPEAGSGDWSPDGRVLARGRRLEVILEPAGFSEEKFLVFERYQKTVHNDNDDTRTGFKRFLCDSPLLYDPAGSGSVLSCGYGSYHQCYYVDGRLAAVGVIDILPRCVSSVYLFYDPDFADLSLGTYSSLREMALVRTLNRQVSAEIEFYYMGYYIPSCPKMTYKARWRPADLLDLTTLTWVPIERCLERIRQHPVFCSFDPRADDRGLVRDTAQDKLDHAPVIDQKTLSDTERRRAMQLVFWIHSDTIFPVTGAQLVAISADVESVVLQGCASLGLPLASRVSLEL